MSRLRQTPILLGFLSVAEEIKKKMLKFDYNLWTAYEQIFQSCHPKSHSCFYSSKPDLSAGGNQILGRLMALDAKKAEGAKNV